jgi:hypothetical protein
MSWLGFIPTTSENGLKTPTCKLFLEQFAWNVEWIIMHLLTPFVWGGANEVNEKSWQLVIIILDEGDGFTFCERLTFVRSWLHPSWSYLQLWFFPFNDVFRLTNVDFVNFNCMVL